MELETSFTVVAFNLNVQVGSLILCFSVTFELVSTSLLLSTQLRLESSGEDLLKG